MARRISVGVVTRSLGNINFVDDTILTAGVDNVIGSNSNFQLNSQNDLRFGDSNNSNWVAFQAPATISSNVTWTLPATDGSANQVIVTNGSGQLSWADSGVQIQNNTTDSSINYVLFATSTSGVLDVSRVSDSGITFQPSTGTLSATVFNGALSTNLSQQVSSLGVNTTAGSTGEIRATGDITAHFSDERLKTLTGKIENALEKIEQLNGYYFVENETARELGYNNTDIQVGVSAQEVEKVLPEVVTDAPINSNLQGADYKTVRYEKLVPLLIEAIKELKKIINKDME